MNLVATAPPSGKTFHLRIQGRRKPSPLWIFATLAGLVLTLFLFLFEVPGPGPDATARRVQILKAATLARQTGLAGLGLFLALGASMVAIGMREFRIVIEGEPSGGLLLKGTSLRGGVTRLDPSKGPYRLAVVRKIRDDLPASKMDMTRMHILASAQEDGTFDSAVSDMIRTDIFLLDRDNTRTEVFSIAGQFPGNVHEVLEALRMHCKGSVEKIRGGGSMLRIPVGSSSSR